MIPDEATTFWTRLLPVSSMYRSPAPLSATPPGAFPTAAGPPGSARPAAQPSPLFPATPVADPAIVYTSPAIIAIPHWVPLLPATSCTRCPSVSAMYTLPPADSTPCGEPKGADAAGPPFPLLVPSPSRVYRSPGAGPDTASHDPQLSSPPSPTAPR